MRTVHRHTIGTQGKPVEVMIPMVEYSIIKANAKKEPNLEWYTDYTFKRCKWLLHAQRWLWETLRRIDLINKSHNTSVQYPSMHHVCNRNVYICAHFSYEMMLCGAYAKCIAGFVKWVYSMDIYWAHCCMSKGCGTCWYIWCMLIADKIWII